MIQGSIALFRLGLSDGFLAELFKKALCTVPPTLHHECRDAYIRILGRGCDTASRAERWAVV